MEEKQKTEVDGFGCVNSSGENRESKGGYLGGLVILYSESVRHRIKVTNSDMTDVIWISLKADVGKEGVICFRV
jgi:hypothetical protein